eukprot:12498742-Alexandrium_andersonii.AAC.1
MIVAQVARCGRLLRVPPPQEEGEGGRHAHEHEQEHAEVPYPAALVTVLLAEGVVHGVLHGVLVGRRPAPVPRRE